MNAVNVNNTNRETANIDRHEVVVPSAKKSHRRGRPKGSKNKPKFDFGVSPELVEAREEGWSIKLGKAKSVAAHRKWQRDYVLPQFVLSRKQAQELLLKFLRSKPGKSALTTVIAEGFVGIKKLPDVKLGEFLVNTNLLSRYPHEVVIRGG